MSGVSSTVLLSVEQVSTSLSEALLNCPETLGLRPLSLSTGVGGRGPEGGGEGGTGLSSRPFAVFANLKCIQLPPEGGFLFVCVAALLGEVAVAPSFNTVVAVGGAVLLDDTAIEASLLERLPLMAAGKKLRLLGSTSNSGETCLKGGNGNWSAWWGISRRLSANKSTI